MRNRNNNLPEATVVGTGLQTTDAQTVHFADAQIKDWQEAYGYVWTEHSYEQVADSLIRKNFSFVEDKSDRDSLRKVYKEEGRAGIIKLVKELIKAKESADEFYEKVDQRWKDLANENFDQFVLESSTECLSREEEVKGHRERLDEIRGLLDEGRGFFNRLDTETHAFVKRYNTAVASPHFDIMVLSNEFAELLKSAFVPLKKFMQKRKQEKWDEFLFLDTKYLLLQREFIKGGLLLSGFSSYETNKGNGFHSYLCDKKHGELDEASDRALALHHDREARRADWAELGEKWEEMKKQLNVMDADITEQVDTERRFSLCYVSSSIQKPVLSIQQQLSSVRSDVSVKNRKNISPTPMGMFNEKNKGNNVNTALSDTSSSNNSNDSSQNQNKKKSSCTIS